MDWARRPPFIAAETIAYLGSMASEQSQKLRLGGMALRNGLLVHGPTHWAAAVRTKDGAIKVASGPKPGPPMA